MPIAIISALPEEQQALLAELQHSRTETLAGRRLFHGQLAGVPVVLVLSGIGKVAAAATTALVLQHAGARLVLFTGVAGGLAAAVRVGDVVVGTGFMQHDMDASPLFPRWVVPSLTPADSRSRFDTDPAAAAVLRNALLHTLPQTSCHVGLIVSGDRFVSSSVECQRLRADLPEALAVDMESAAVAQVCADFGAPLAVLRSISDRADDAAHVDFPRFLAEVAAPLAHAVVMAALPALATLVGKAQPPA
jgi:adenosylhomocysteine nucleosidase